MVFDLVVQPPERRGEESATGDVARGQDLAAEKVRRENSSRAELMKGAYLRDVFEKYGVL